MLCSQFASPASSHPTQSLLSPRHSIWIQRWMLVFPLLWRVRGSNMNGFLDLRTTPQQRRAKCRLRLSASPNCFEPSPGWTWLPGLWPIERQAFFCVGGFTEIATQHEMCRPEPCDAPREAVCLLAWRRRSPRQPAAAPTREGVFEWEQETNKPRAPLHDKSPNTASR